MGTKTETIHIYQLKKNYGGLSEWEHPRQCTAEAIEGIKVVIRPRDKERKDTFHVPWHMVEGIVERRLEVEVPDPVEEPPAQQEEPAPPKRGRTPKAAMAGGQ